MTKTSSPERPVDPEAPAEAHRGKVVELDPAVDDPVDIFVNVVRLGTGHLVVGDDGEWAFRVAEASAGPTLDRALAGTGLHRDEHPADERKES